MAESAIRYWQCLTTVEAKALVADDPVVILPLAGVEQHGPHLPLSTDLDIGVGILERAFHELPDDFPAWVLPPQSVGTSTEHTSFAGTLSVTPTLLAELLHALGTSVARSGVRRLVVSNSHGGNVQAVDDAGRRLRKELGLLVVKSDYFLFPRPEVVELPESEWRHGLHGGAVETAMMLHLHPDLVGIEQAADSTSLGQELEHTMRRVGAETPGASFSWLAEDLNAAGVTGNATLAHPALGKRLVDAYGQALAEVIQDTRAFPIERLV